MGHHFAPLSNQKPHTSDSVSQRQSLPVINVEPHHQPIWLHVCVCKKLIIIIKASLSHHYHLDLLLPDKNKRKKKMSRKFNVRALNWEIIRKMWRWEEKTCERWHELWTTRHHIVRVLSFLHDITQIQQILTYSQDHRHASYFACLLACLLHTV